MTWTYDMSEEEMTAAALLRNKGWEVRSPQCPDCHGWGHVWVTERVPPFDDVQSMSTKPCPRGCPTPAMYFSSAA